MMPILSPLKNGHDLFNRGVAVLYPGIRSGTHRGIHFYAQSLIAGLAQAGCKPALVTDAAMPSQNKGGAQAILQAITAPAPAGKSSLAALPRYLMHRAFPELMPVQAYACGSLTTSEDTRYLERVDLFLNAPAIYDMARLASNKPCLSPVKLDMVPWEAYPVAFTSEPLAVRPPTRGPKLVQTVHDLIILNSRHHQLNSQKFLRRLHACIKYADLILAVSEYTRAEIIDRYPSVADRIRVIYQPLPADQQWVTMSESPETQQTILKKFDLHAEGFIFYVGAVEERKNIARLIRAHQESRHAKHFPLILAGPLDEAYIRRENISSLLDRRTSSSRVRHIGRISELEKLCLLRNAAFFAFPTITEGFGLPLLEAQSMGCPVITSRAGAIPEVVGDTAMLVDNPLDEEEISTVLDAMACADASVRAAIRQRGTVNVQRFNRDQFARQLQELVKSL